MTADLLREAAALMRERAKSATQGPWRFETAPNGFSPMVIGGGMAVADTFDKPHLSDAKHIAGMHPAVALAVADWLDDEAEWIDAGSTLDGNPALTVARAYLRSES